VQAVGVAHRCRARYPDHLFLMDDTKNIIWDIKISFGTFSSFMELLPPLSRPPVIY
jgi:hypothetical protein